MTQEYPTLAALMAGREPGSVKVCLPGWSATEWVRPGCMDDSDQTWVGLDERGEVCHSTDAGPWLLIESGDSRAEDAPAPSSTDAADTLRLEIAAGVLAALHITSPLDNLIGGWGTRHAYALAEADALLAEARRAPSAEARK